MKPWRLLGCCVALSACAAPAWSRDLDYGLLNDAGLQRCDAQRWSLERAAATACYRALLSRNDPALRAEAAWALGDFKSANEWFRDALLAQPKSVTLRLRWGALFLDTHQDGEAYKLFQEALKLEPQNGWALEASADVLVRDYAKESQAALEAALQAQGPPGALLRAHLLAARVQLESGEQAEAARHLEQAGAIASKNSLPQLELQTLQAALAQLQGRDNAALVATVSREAPGYGELYLTLGHFFDIRRRYDEATALFRKAMETQPDLWEARVQVATGLLREGRESEARTLFEEAYKGDPYNPVTANTLRLLDTLARFDTLVYPDAPAGAAAPQAPQVIVRVNKKESAVLAPYVRRLAERAMAEYSRRYHYTVPKPITIEIYDSHEDFAVRTAGMPGLGLLGVTFGHVLAMDSPSSRAVNEFHWGSTLWHELAHVYTLESTGHRVPRWFSEGISVYEEWSHGPTPGINVPGYAWAALAAGKGLPIEGLDRGFIRPEYPQQVQVSYMQAGLICEFIVKRFGADKLVAMLGEYGRGADTPAAIKSGLGIDAAQFDREFGEYLHQDFGAVLSGIRPWGEARAAATRAAKAKNWSEAITAAQRALQVLPVDVEDGSPYVVLAEAQFATGRNDDALATLNAFWKHGGHEPEALAKLASEEYARGRKDDAIAVMQDIDYVAPYDEAQHGRLGEWLLEQKRAAEALDEFKVALALHPADGATAHYRLARAYLALDRKQEARSEVLRSLDIAPSYRPAQQLLLQLAGTATKS